MLEGLKINSQESVKYAIKGTRYDCGKWNFTLMIRIEHFNNSPVIIDTNNISAISSLFVVL